MTITRKLVTVMTFCLALVLGGVLSFAMDPSGAGGVWSVSGSHKTSQQIGSGHSTDRNWEVNNQSANPVDVEVVDSNGNSDMFRVNGNNSTSFTVPAGSKVKVNGVPNPNNPPNVYTAGGTYTHGPVNP